MSIPAVSMLIGVPVMKGTSNSAHTFVLMSGLEHSFAPKKSVPAMDAPPKLASTQFALRKDAPRKSALMKSALVASAPVKSLPGASASPKSASPRKALTNLALVRLEPLKDAPEPGSCLKATRSNWSPPACTNWKDKSPEKVVPDMVVSPSNWHESRMASVKDASRKDAPLKDAERIFENLMSAKSRLTWSKTASIVESHRSQLVLDMSAPRKMLQSIFAPDTSAVAILAPVKSAPSNSEPCSFAFHKYAPRKVAPSALTPARFAPRRSAQSSRAPDRSTPPMSASLRLAPRRSAPRMSRQHTPAPGAPPQPKFAPGLAWCWHVAPPCLRVKPFSFAYEVPSEVATPGSEQSMYCEEVPSLLGLRPRALPPRAPPPCGASSLSQHS
mmetsp:Transcript_15208/g.49633  ORF Transcript_15208/g.49633 Transcript_15208/m.49633 type:complete len:386 (+) Transcript_15208:250-1407(+)